MIGYTRVLYVVNGLTMQWLCLFLITISTRVSVGRGTYIYTYYIRFENHVPTAREEEA